MSSSGPAPSADRLLALIDAMAGKPVLMNVDLVADRFIVGTPKRVSREAPVLILEYESERFVPGGGANAVANVAALDGQPLPLGVVGDDDSGKALLAAFAERGVDLDGVVTLSGYRTPTKTRILGGGHHGIKQQIVRYDVEDFVQMDDGVATRLRGALAGWAQRASVAVLSDYGYGTVLPEFSETVRDCLQPPSIVLCDSRYRLQDFAAVDGATPNEEEAEILAGEAFSDDLEQVAELGRRLRHRLDCGFLLITRGSSGMCLVTADDVVHLPVHGTDQVADVTGAGDTVIGTFALAMAAGAEVLEAALLANYAGGIVVHKLGTATASREELAQAVGSDPLPRERLLWDRS